MVPVVAQEGPREIAGRALVDPQEKQGSPGCKRSTGLCRNTQEQGIGLQ